jgi:hypothetical protein
VVLEEHSGDWFEDPGPSPYMLQTTRVQESKRHLVPAILHLDDSARHQTLAQETNPRLYEAIEAFRAETGVPMLCNTSLNEKGEPIVDTGSQALSFALRKGIRVAYVGGHRVQLREDTDNTGPTSGRRHARREDLFAGQESSRDAIWNSWLEQGYTTTALVLMSRSPELRDQALAPAPLVNELAAVGTARDKSGTLKVADDKHARMFGPTAEFDTDSREGAVF